MKIYFSLRNIRLVLCVILFTGGLGANPKPAKIVEGTENGTSASSQAQAATFCKNALFKKKATLSDRTIPFYQGPRSVRSIVRIPETPTGSCTG